MSEQEVCIILTYLGSPKLPHASYQLSMAAV